MNKIALALGIVGILTYSVPTIPVKATSNTYTPSITTDTPERAAGIISGYSVTVSSGNSIIYVTAKTQAYISMKTIGYKDISIEYSSDGINWYNEKDIDDLLKSDSSSYYLNNYAVSVKGGYYYRVSLTHYAKESGWFGSSQSVNNTSNSVWIDWNVSPWHTLKGGGLIDCSQVSFCSFFKKICNNYTINDFLKLRILLNHINLINKKESFKWKK